MRIEAADASAGALLAAPRGLLRVTTPLSVGTTVLPRIVAAYLKRHREVHVDLVLSNRHLDLLTDRLDAGVSFGALPDSGLAARALPPMRLFLCALPANLSSTLASYAAWQRA